MQTITVEIKNDNALKVLQDLHEKHHIEIRANLNPEFYIFPGEPITTEEFQAMIERAELSGSMSLKEAKAKWVSQRKQLLNTGK